MKTVISGLHSGGELKLTNAKDVIQVEATRGETKVVVIVESRQLYEAVKAHDALAQKAKF